MKDTKKCDENCLECKYADCIVDVTPSEKRAAYYRNYRQKHKEEIRIYQREYQREYRKDQKQKEREKNITKKI